MVGALLLALAAAAVPALADPALEQARADFKRVWPAALDGQWPLDRATERRLKTYPLWPDLRAAWYSARLKDTSTAELDRFIARYAKLAPIRRLQYRRTAALAQQRRWSEFLRHYDANYATLQLASMDCFALQAAVDGARNRSQLPSLVQSLWLVGHSQDDACDTPFVTLIDNGTIDTRLIRERMQLAIDAGNFGLAGYLARRLGDSEREAVERWKRTRSDPAGLLDDALRQPRRYSAAQLVAATRRLALRDAPAAARAWAAIGNKRPIDADDDADVRRYIAIAAAQDYESQAADWLRDVPPVAVDERVRAWQARTAMRNGDWRSVAQSIDSMAPGAQQSDRWRYWRARAAEQLGDTQQALGQLQALAEERSYFGFLAADRVGLPYAFAPAPLTRDDATLNTLAGRADVARVRELLAVGQPARARSEWQRLLRGLDDAERRAAALLAHDWQWHDQAISVLGALQSYDDLDMRYPLTLTDAFDKYSVAAGIDSNWALGIARSESLFAADARSSAGAIGLMQLMPATARKVARDSGERWRGSSMLTDAEANMALGTRYLSELAERFEHPALATAAYNAGPHRIDRWRPRGSELPADIWIESIAYDETRRYVERVLAAQVIFAWRRGQDVPSLLAMLTPVAGADTP